MILGITGGIGAGKSTVLDILEKEYNGHKIVADDVARELMEPGNSVYKDVVSCFGDVIVSRNGRGDIDKAVLADIIYNDKDKRKLLNSIVHPAVKKEILKKINIFYAEDKNALILIEAALLIEDGYKDIVDELWVVTAKKEVRISRLMNDRGYSREKAQSIMASQLTDEEYISHADLVIDNSLSEAATAIQIARRMKELQN